MVSTTSTTSTCLSTIPSGGSGRCSGIGVAKHGRKHKILGHSSRFLVSHCRCRYFSTDDPRSFLARWRFFGFSSKTVHFRSKKTAMRWI